MNEIIWEDPPVNAAGRPSEWMRYAEKLQEHPGKWALVGTWKKVGGGSSLQSRLKRLGCEAVTRSNDDGCRLYARWPEGA